MLRRSFTLIEMLVVLSIIAPLATVLMPALARSRAQAQLAACENNLRQMGQALYMYRGDHEDRLPTASKGGNAGEVYEALRAGGYLENVEILRCPGDEYQGSIDFEDPDTISYLIDPTTPQDRHPMRAIMAEDPRKENHADGVNVLFEDGHVLFTNPDANPYGIDFHFFAGPTPGHSEQAVIRWDEEMPGSIGFYRPGEEVPFEVPETADEVTLVLIGGGGGGGANSHRTAGGGGAGGVVVVTLTDLTPGQVFDFEVGEGGPGRSPSGDGHLGEETTFVGRNGAGTVNIVAKGGGGGGNVNADGLPGGSGGGGGRDYTVATSGGGFDAGSGYDNHNGVGYAHPGSDGTKSHGAGGGGAAGEGGTLHGGEGFTFKTLIDRIIAENRVDDIDIGHLKIVRDAFPDREFAGGGTGNPNGSGSHGGGCDQVRDADEGAWGSGGGGRHGSSGAGADGLIIIVY